MSFNFCIVRFCYFFDYHSAIKIIYFYAPSFIHLENNVIFSRIWDTKFDVKSFSMGYYSDGLAGTFPAKGSKMTAEMKSLIANAKNGDVFVFDDVIAVGSDSLPRKLRSIAFNIR